MMPLTDCFWLFRIDSKKKGLKLRSHKACFEEPSCSSVNYQIFGAKQRVFQDNYSECHHDSSRNHEQHRRHVVLELVALE